MRRGTIYIVGMHTTEARILNYYLFSSCWLLRMLVYVCLLVFCILPMVKCL